MLRGSANRCIVTSIAAGLTDCDPQPVNYDELLNTLRYMKSLKRSTRAGDPRDVDGDVPRLALTCPPEQFVALLEKHFGQIRDYCAQLDLCLSERRYADALTIARRLTGTAQCLGTSGDDIAALREYEHALELEPTDAIERAAGNAQIVAFRLCVAIKDALADQSAKRDCCN